MAKNIGQYAGEVYPNDEEVITTFIKEASNSPYFKSISKIGIQLAPSKRIFINDIEFEIGKTGKLEFDNLNIKAVIKISHEKNNNSQNKIPVIIDYVYIEKE